MVTGTGERAPHPAAPSAGSGPSAGPAPASTSGADPGPDERAARLLEAFAEHLSVERGRSPHTVRAYVGDVRDLLAAARRRGGGDPADVDLALLRAWLSGEARAL
ncbi:site-specific integrase, partial [Pseudokineococcus marinus]